MSSLGTVCGPKSQKQTKSGLLALFSDEKGEPVEDTIATLKQREEHTHTPSASQPKVEATSS